MKFRPGATHWTCSLYCAREPLQATGYGVSFVFLQDASYLFFCVEMGIAGIDLEVPWPLDVLEWISIRIF